MRDSTSRTWTIIYSLINTIWNYWLMTLNISLPGVKWFIGFLKLVFCAKGLQRSYFNFREATSIPDHSQCNNLKSISKRHLEIEGNLICTIFVYSLKLRFLLLLPLYNHHYGVFLYLHFHGFTIWEEKLLNGVHGRYLVINKYVLNRKNRQARNEFEIVSCRWCSVSTASLPSLSAFVP